MAKQLVGLTRSLQKLQITRSLSSPLLTWQDSSATQVRLLSTTSVLNTSFFNKLPANHLWNSITSVSNAGKKRGRGKRVSRKLIKDLNKGQIIGVGKANIVWPGLSAPIIRGKELVEQVQLPEDPEREQKLIELRNKMGFQKYAKLSPLERGWSGTKMPGRSLGPPDPIGEDNFEGFDSRVIELRNITIMKGNFGRKRRMSALVVTGNKNGLGGFAMGKALEGKNALRKAKNRSGQKLMHIRRYNDHTVCHNFFTQFGSTKIFVWQKPEGYGLKCHRAIKTICEVIGIKNLYAKIEGPTNVNHIMKAFFLGLIRQKTPEQIAQEKGLHLVQISEETNYFPKVIASPAECKKKEDLLKDEILDYNQYCFDGRVVLKKKIKPPFYMKLASFQRYIKRYERTRSQPEVRRNLIAEYGEVRSFLADKYPECRVTRYVKKKPQEEEEGEGEEAEA
ncbi:28S ribosomal protein S5, mitochondrial [Anthonomus grandis grandis]|uniref:28S ribosomal protein S5, mitochondrial n=1 Tax=Anthonomus grandis grandis TaxID=2921223 RepID=UPI002165A540|nr:28S ribosomal protein S5, mitochondrial [Anthonomus grandis grandis]